MSNSPRRKIIKARRLMRSQEQRGCPLRWSRFERAVKDLRKHARADALAIALFMRGAKVTTTGTGPYTHTVTFPREQR